VYWYAQEVQPPEDALTVQDLAARTNRRKLCEEEPQEEDDELNEPHQGVDDVTDRSL